MMGWVAEQLPMRARRHAALGDVMRLAMVDDLAVSDRSPKELADRFGLASNLLAHHLDVLSEADVIERFPSTGDRRRRYVRLRDSARAYLGPRSGALVGSALFVCTHNSARSQLAAALWRARTGQAASSAGTHPTPTVHPGARAAARRAGLHIGQARPRLLDPAEDAEFVITVCDRAHEELKPPSSWWHWSLPDPVELATPEAFDVAISTLDARIHTLLDVN
jgi:ArsR family transcriptional regulator, arsenate/arsenite/antimonite-responsive transcriptional repressor / arsenate reductase (thioredoxin)